MKQLHRAAIIAAVSLPLFANPPPVASDPPIVAAGEVGTCAWRMDAGGDLRLRHEAIGNDPSTTLNAGEHVDYFRLRTRAWFEIGHGNVSLYTRVANEIRDYNGYTPTMMQSVPVNPWKFPDEIVLDNFYLDIQNLAGGQLDLRIGRQDMMYGAGRVIFDGTPGDETRTHFFDAIKASLHLTDKTSLDAFLIYNTPDAQDLVIRSRERDLIDGVDPNVTERGGGLYLKYNEMNELPAEVYYIYKRESLGSAVPTPAPARDIHTVGVRIMPRFNEQLGAEIESAVQFGGTEIPAPGHDISAFMCYADLTHRPDFGLQGQPFFTAALYYLSGDDYDVSGDDNRWNPPWARHRQFSDLMALAYPGSRYSNLVYPHLKIGIDCPSCPSCPSYKHAISLHLGLMYAEEEDSPAPNDHSYQGMRTGAKYEFPLVKGMFGERGDIFGHLMADVFIPPAEGKGYYANNEMGYFLRWEISAKF